MTLMVLLSLLTPSGTEARKKDIDGVRLWYSVKGNGEPTVVFDSGLGDTHDVWRWVWPRVARETSVFLYDRAGLGRSDPGPAPRSPARMVEELRQLLSAARLEPPFILVGHSLGGLNARLLAATYPDDVAGIVLVDAMPPRFPGEFLKTGPARAKIETMLSAAPRATRMEYRAITAGDGALEIGDTAPGLPAAVLCSQRQDEDPDFRNRWITLQHETAVQLNAATYEVVEGAGHYLQYDAPDDVIEAILKVVEQSRHPVSARTPD